MIRTISRDGGLSSGVTESTSAEGLILEAMEAGNEMFTVSRLCAITALSPADVRLGLVNLHDRGLVGRLNTLVESWVPRPTDRCGRQ